MAPEDVNDWPHEVEFKFPKGYEVTESMCRVDGPSPGTIDLDKMFTIHLGPGTIIKNGELEIRIRNRCSINVELDDITLGVAGIRGENNP